MSNEYVIKVISGGQTGADQGALRAARDLGIDTGGIAPNGWLTEDGPQELLLRAFGLVECDVPGYPARTRMNVANSDGTLLVGQYQTGGSALTHEIATELDKPVFHLPYPSNAHREFLEWLHANNIRTLNVAGDRESASPGIAAFTYDFLTGSKVK